MRADRPSLTAAVVSFARGAVSAAPGGPCFDPVAKTLLPSPFTHLLEALEAHPGPRRVLEPLIRAFSLGLVDHIELRTALIDQALADGVLAGARQLVVLGAGLDARAFRLEILREVDVFEVDHPATQAWKEDRVRGLSPKARSVTLLPVDFETTSLGEALDRSAFRREVPTFWIWEGVTPYLNPPAIEATLAAVAERSAPRSRVAISYVTPEIIAQPRVRALTFPVFKLISEPLHGILTRTHMEALLEAHGLHVLSDELPADAGPRFGRPGRRAIFSPAERVVVARRP